MVSALCFSSAAEDKRSDSIPVHINDHKDQSCTVSNCTILFLAEEFEAECAKPSVTETLLQTETSENILTQDLTMLPLPNKS